MKKKIINMFLKLIKGHKTCSESDLRIYHYGLEALYNLTTKMTVTLLICIFLNVKHEFFLLLLSYAFLRTFGYGIHAETSLKCWITTLSIYVGGSIIISIILVPKTISLIIWSISLISFLFWAPADTPKRPLIRIEKRIKLKKRICIVMICYFILLLYINNTLIINALTLGILIELICINPLTYKLLNVQFNSYKYYKKGLNAS